MSITTSNPHIVYPKYQSMDRKDSFSASDLENVLRLKDLGARHWKVVACSAVTGAGLDEGFSWLVGDIASRIFLLE